VIFDGILGFLNQQRWSLNQENGEHMGFLIGMYMYLCAIVDYDLL